MKAPLSPPLSLSLSLSLSLPHSLPLPSLLLSLAIHRWEWRIRDQRQKIYITSLLLKTFLLVYLTVLNDHYNDATPKGVDSWYRGCVHSMWQRFNHPQTGSYLWVTPRETGISLWCSLAAVYLLPLSPLGRPPWPIDLFTYSTRSYVPGDPMAHVSPHEPAQCFYCWYWCSLNYVHPKYIPQSCQTWRTMYIGGIYHPHSVYYCFN